MDTARAGCAIAPDELGGFVAALLGAAGAPAAHAGAVADALVEAELQGLASHGVMLLPLYLKRIAAGSVDPTATGVIVSERAGALVMDARNGFGQVTAAHALSLAVARARINGLAAVSVRDGFHFGAAGRWAAAMAREGCIGIATCNTRPLMPPPGGAARVVGNNPLAIAAPGGPDGDPVVVDFALSEAAMGKIRLAEEAGIAIPPNWATDAAGTPTTNPTEAIAGMLLPAGGAKGFGLALMLDILSGGLSAGALGGQVGALYGDPAVPYRCAHFFLAIDVASFRDRADFGAAVAGLLRGVRASPAVEPGASVRVPGEGARARQRAATMCQLPAGTAAALRDSAAALGCVVPTALSP